MTKNVEYDIKKLVKQTFLSISRFALFLLLFNVVVVFPMESNIDFHFAVHTGHADAENSLGLGTASCYFLVPQQHCLFTPLCPFYEVGG